MAARIAGALSLTPVGSAPFGTTVLKLGCDVVTWPTVASAELLTAETQRVQRKIKVGKRSQPAARKLRLLEEIFKPKWEFFIFVIVFSPRGLTAASQTIGRELEALPIFQGANREPDRSEGSGRPRT